MDITPKQLKQLLGEAVADELIKKLKPIESKIDNLTTSVDGLTLKVDSYLNQEWSVHIHQSHPNLDKRVKACERKLGIKAT